MPDLAVGERQALARAAARSGAPLLRSAKHVTLLVDNASLASLSMALVEAGQETLAERLRAAWERSQGPVPDLALARRTLQLSQRPHLVGILNATPDSIFDRSRYYGLQAGIERALELVAEGADVIEVGGHSARVGTAIDLEEELRRVVPLIERLSATVAVPLAVDTWRAEVARQAVAAGAEMLNDISGLADLGMARVAAERGAALVVMHIVGQPKVDHSRQQYRALMDEVFDFLWERTERAVALGVRRDRLAVDPGLSFAKQTHHDLEMMRRLGELRSLGYPIYLATSRKTYLRHVLHLPVEELLEGTQAAVALGVLQGASLIRVHDVATMRRVTAMATLLRSEMSSA